MSTLNYIFELLYEHDCVIVPGFGGFVANYRPAKIHPVLHTFSPPAKDILFNPRLVINDGILVNYIAVKENIPYERALQQLQAEILQIQQHLEQSHKFEIVNVGSLSLDMEGHLQFEPADKINFLLSSYGLGSFVSPAIQREKTGLQLESLTNSHTEYRKERRLPVALKKSVIIGIPAAAMLAFAIFTAGGIGDWIPQTSDLFPNFSIKSAETPAASDISRNIARPFEKNFFDLRKKGFRTVDQEALQHRALAQESGKFCIVANCFSIEENAIQYTQDMKAQGFAGAGYFKPASANLYRAYISRHASRTEAEAALEEIKQQHVPQAWILEM